MKNLVCRLILLVSLFTPLAIFGQVNSPQESELIHKKINDIYPRKKIKIVTINGEELKGSITQINSDNFQFLVAGKNLRMINYSEVKRVSVDKGNAVQRIGKTILSVGFSIILLPFISVYCVCTTCGG